MPRQHRSKGPLKNQPRPPGAGPGFVFASFPNAQPMAFGQVFLIQSAAAVDSL
jgi:hypothetical protein